MPSTQRLLTIGQAARMFMDRRVSPNVIYRWIDKGKLQSVQRDGKELVSESDVRALMPTDDQQPQWGYDLPDWKERNRKIVPCADLTRYQHLFPTAGVTSHWRLHRLFKKCPVCSRHFAVACQTFDWSCVRGVTTSVDGRRFPCEVCSDYCGKLLIEKERALSRLHIRLLKRQNEKRKQHRRLETLLKQTKRALRENRRDLLPSLQEAYQREATSRR